MFCSQIQQIKFLWVVVCGVGPTPIDICIINLKLYSVKPSLWPIPGLIRESRVLTGALPHITPGNPTHPHSSLIARVTLAYREPTGNSDWIPKLRATISNRSWRLWAPCWTLLKSMLSGVCGHSLLTWFRHRIVLDPIQKYIKTSEQAC